MMASKRHTPEQIINKLGQAEVEIANGATIAQVCKKIGVTGRGTSPVSHRGSEARRTTPPGNVDEDTVMATTCEGAANQSVTKR
jgi:hypothetical protein